jgi:hypothetical protein
MEQWGGEGSTWEHRVEEGEGGPTAARPWRAHAARWRHRSVRNSGRRGRLTSVVGWQCQLARVKWYSSRFKSIPCKLNRFKQTSNRSNFNWSKRDLLKLKKIEIKIWCWRFWQEEQLSLHKLIKIRSVFWTKNQRNYWDLNLKEIWGISSWDLNFWWKLDKGVLFEPRCQLNLWKGIWSSN